MPRFRRAAYLGLSCALVPAAAAACGSAGDKKVASAPTINPRPATCPTPSPAASPPVFPSSASSDLPRPTFATAPQELPTQVHGVTLLRFTTAMPLRDAAKFLLTKYPAAGYRIVGGDSEQDEADAPFVKGDLHGTTRLSGTGPCSTTWLVAVTKGNAKLDKIPQLAPHDQPSADETS